MIFDSFRSLRQIRRKWVSILMDIDHLCFLFFPPKCRELRQGPSQYKTPSVSILHGNAEVVEK